jgi:hypothetical protein
VGLFDSLKARNEVRKGDVVVAYVASAFREPEGTLTVGTYNKKGRVGSQVVLATSSNPAKARVWEGRVVEVQGSSGVKGGLYWYRVRMNREPPPGVVPPLPTAAELLGTPEAATGEAERTPASSPAAGDPMARIKKLSELKEAGLISQEEFDAQRARILAEL